MINTTIGNDWDEKLKDLFNDSKVTQTLEAVENEYKNNVCYPPEEDIFNAFKYTSYTDTRVVILGQDPYIKEGQAQGLSFSVPAGVQIPPSLLNIFKELQGELECYIPNNGCLIPWAKQGVFLLNSILTVREYESNSHKDIGWEYFTDKVIEILNQKENPICFMLWGAYARQKAQFIDQDKHLVLFAAHPSPLARGAFFGCNHFSKCNKFLKDEYGKQIDWQIKNI